MTHPLDGARRKVNRADRKLREFESEVIAWLESDFYEITQDSDAKLGRHMLYTRLRKPPEPEWANVAAEALEQSRNALDHLIRRLVEANGHNPKKSNVFPIYTREGDFKSVKIANVAPRWKAELRSLQPYQRGHNFAGHPLYKLNTLVQTDKHVDTNAVVVGLVRPVPAFDINLLLEPAVDIARWRVILPNWVGMPIDGARLAGMDTVPFHPETRLEYHGKLTCDVALGEARIPFRELRELVRVVGKILTHFEPAFG